MKKILLCLILLLGLCGCNKDKSVAIDSNKASEFSGVAISEDGVYYISTIGDDSFVSFYDFNAGTSVPLCNKSGCRHNTMNCQAYELADYQGGDLVTLAYCNEQLYLYYINYYDYSVNTFMVADKDGTNRKKIFDIPKEALVNQAFLFKDDIYLSLNMVGEIDENSGGITGTTLYIYDRKSNDLKLIDSSKNNVDIFLYYIGFIDDSVYYICSDATNKEYPIYEYDITTEETECVNDDNKIDSAVLIDEELYYIDENTLSINSYNIFNNTITEISKYEPHEGELTYLSGNGVVRIGYITDPNTMDSRMYKQIYDIEKDEFLFANYKEYYDIFSKLSNGYYIGSINYEFTLFDEKLNAIELK